MKSGKQVFPAGTRTLQWDGSSAGKLTAGHVRDLSHLP